MNLLSVTKAVLSLITSTGVGNIVGNVVRVSTPANQSTFNKITTTVASFVLTGMIADKATEYLNEQIDGIFETKSKPVEQSTDAS